MSILRRLLRTKFDSGDYWRRRYEKNQTSGPGSYGRLARYKADIVNGLVSEHDIGTVIEFGCGDGNQADLFEINKYTGIDISPIVIANARQNFAVRDDWSFHTPDEFTVHAGTHDMSMSLDVIYHLVEDAVFEAYMHDLVLAASRYVLIYASDHDEVTKDVHVRHRCFTDWIARNAPDLNLLQVFEHPYPASEGSDGTETSFAHFKLFERAV